MGDKHRKGEVNMERSKTTEQGAVVTDLTTNRELSNLSTRAK